MDRSPGEGGATAVAAVVAESAGLTPIGLAAPVLVTVPVVLAEGDEPAPDTWRSALRAEAGVPHREGVFVPTDPATDPVRVRASSEWAAPASVWMRRMADCTVARRRSLWLLPLEAEEAEGPLPEAAWAAVGVDGDEEGDGDGRPNESLNPPLDRERERLVDAWPWKVWARASLVIRRGGAAKDRDRDRDRESPEGAWWSAEAVAEAEARSADHVEEAASVARGPAPACASSPCVRPRSMACANRPTAGQVGLAGRCVAVGP